tara:strand:+ start:3309 stop:6452 length:3144 start_codon:yes stop_codon:yes gene_type:complete
MGQIQVNTPQGPQIINIAGETPTDAEQQAIVSQFFTNVKPDFATATKEEVENYARQERLLGRQPLSGDTITEEEYVSEYKEPNVDYSSGVKSNDLFSRFTYGSLETDEERKGYLDGIIGSEGYRVDGLGRFLITKKGRETLGLGKGKEVAIDEEGLSFSDVKEFAGATVFPITVGIGASLMASGVGFIPGSLIVGGSMAAAKVLDESIESLRGLQRQSPKEIARDSAFEGLFGVLGEGAGRGISRLLGRLIKGPGGKANEVLRKQARELINKGYKPTIAGATDEAFRPVLNRLQAVYEGVFPNKVAADINLEGILKELKGAGIYDNTAINNVQKVVQRDIDQLYGTASDTLATAQNNMDKAIVTEINQIRKVLKDGGNIEQDLANQLTLRKTIFDEDVDALYSQVQKNLGGEQRIIPTGGLLQAFKTLQKDAFANDITSSGVGKEILRLGEAKFATPREMNRLRTGLTDAGYNTDLFAGTTTRNLTVLKEAITDAFDDAALTLQQMKNRIDPAVKSGGGAKGLATPTDNLGSTFENLSESLNLLDRTNKFYSKGMARFDDPVFDQVIAEAKRGTINSDFLYTKIQNKPELLQKVLLAVRGVPTGIVDIAKGTKYIQSQRIANRTFPQALEDLKSLDPTSRVRLDFEKRIADKLQDAKDISLMRGKGAQVAEEIREGLAKRFLGDAINKSQSINTKTGVNVTDPLKLVNELTSKGPLLKALFRNNMPQLNNLIQVLRRGKADLSPGVMKQLETEPLGKALTTLRQAEIEETALKKNNLLRSLEKTTNPEEIANLIFKDVSSIKQAEKLFSPVVMEEVKGAAMGNILRKLGATTDEAGTVQFTTDFVEKFTSGRLGSSFQNILKSYGPETVNKMFGPNGFAALNKLADNMVKVSNKPIAGKGGLAAPAIALGFGLLAMITSPLATLPPAAAFWFMSKALRNPKILKMMMGSRQPNSYKQLLAGKLKANDPVAQGFQALWALQAQALVQSSRMTTEEIAPTEETVTEITTPLKKLGTEVINNVQETSSQLPSGSEVLRRVEQEKLLGVRN